MYHFNDPYILREYAQWIESNINPNVYAVIHIKRSADGVWLDRKRIEEAASKFMIAVSREAHGSRRWRKLEKGKRLLTYATTLEKADTNPHLNFLIHRPDKMDFEELRNSLYESWNKGDWMSQDTASFYCEERKPDTQLAGYVLKEGPDSLLERAMNHTKA